MNNFVGLSEATLIPPVALWFGQGNTTGHGGKPIPDALETTLKGKRVLIVEDEMFVALHLESVLQDLGLEICDIVASGGRAVESVTTMQPDLIFMDINLRGDIDGVEAARLIRTTSAIPIVFVTAYGDEAMLTRINAATPNAPVIQKPPMTSTLLAALRKATQY